MGFKSDKLWNFLTKFSLLYISLVVLLRLRLYNYLFTVSILGWESEVQCGWWRDCREGVGGVTLHEREGGETLWWNCEEWTPIHGPSQWQTGTILPWDSEAYRVSASQSNDWGSRLTMISIYCLKARLHFIASEKDQKYHMLFLNKIYRSNSKMIHFSRPINVVY